MLNNILNIAGASVLSKEQQKSIKGGVFHEECHVLVEGVNGFEQPYITQVPDGQACDYASGYFANEYGPVARCRYDCAGDGYTATWWNPSWNEQ